MSSPPSPCINICKIDRVTGFCEGCGRTIPEITEWAAASEQRQAEIVEALPLRLNRLRMPSLPNKRTGG